MLLKSYQDLDQDNKADFGLHVPTRMGCFREVVARPADPTHCAADCHFVTIHPTKGWDVERAFCLLPGELAFAAAKNCLVGPSSLRTQWPTGELLSMEGWGRIVEGVGFLQYWPWEAKSPSWPASIAKDVLYSPVLKQHPVPKSSKTLCPCSTAACVDLIKPAGSGRVG